MDGRPRKVLSERLRDLVDHAVLERRPYQNRPVRYAYELTERGRAFLPVLIGMQDWADRWLLGDGTLTATAEDGSAEAARVRELVGTAVPPGLLLPGSDGAAHDVVAAHADATVMFTYPATGVPSPLPDGWADIPGAAGCTLENRLFVTPGRPSTRRAWRCAGSAPNARTNRPPSPPPRRCPSPSCPTPSCGSPPPSGSPPSARRSNCG